MVQIKIDGGTDRQDGTNKDRWRTDSKMVQIKIDGRTDSKMVQIKIDGRTDSKMVQIKIDGGKDSKMVQIKIDGGTDRQDGTNKDRWRHRQTRWYK